MKNKHIMKYIFTFVAGLSIGLGVAWLAIKLTFYETDKLLQASTNASLIDNHLAYLDRSDDQLRCAIARSVALDYSQLKEAYPLESFWTLPDELTYPVNRLMEFSIAKYEGGATSEFVNSCPSYQHDCSEIKTNLDALLCSGT